MYRQLYFLAPKSMTYSRIALKKTHAHTYTDIIYSVNMLSRSWHMSTESMLQSIQAFSIQQNPDPNTRLVHANKHGIRSFGFVNC